VTTTKKNPRQVRFKLTPLPGGGYTGLIVLPSEGNAIAAVKAKGPTKAAAIDRAAKLAQDIAANPVMAALLPPGTPAALHFAGKLAGAVRSGQGRALIEKAKSLGAGGKRLAKALGF
jgi:hypothetical protein